MIYGRPIIQELTSLDLFFERLVPRAVQPLANTDWRAKKLKEFIDQDQDSVRWRLGDACKQLGFPISDRQARRLFKISVGVGIEEYSRNRRLARAADQLRVTNMPIKVVAAEAGYQNSRHFARRFKELFHLRPMEFRNIWRRREFAV
jgi:methylphosphotriester-DNA--protein-cysteine methyltransferase